MEGRNTTGGKGEERESPAAPLPQEDCKEQCNSSRARSESTGGEVRTGKATRQMPYQRGEILVDIIL